MNTEQSIAHIVLTNEHEATGNCRHYKVGEVLPDPHQLRIVQYDAGGGFYLLYLDYNGEELTDTFHDTLDAALQQAEWEFRVPPAAWRFSNPRPLAE